MLRGNRQAGFRTVHPIPAPAVASTLDALWASIPRFEGGFTTMDYRRTPPPDDVAFALWIADGAVHILVRAGTISTGSVRTLAPGEKGSLVHTDNFEVMIDPRHDHMNYLWIQWAAGGARRSAQRQVCEFALRCDVVQREDAVAVDRWTLEEQRTAEAWYSRVSLPLDMPGLEGAAEAVTWGFNMVQSRWVDRRIYEPVWSPSARFRPVPWDFGEVRLRPSALAVRELDFGEVYHDWNALRMGLENISASPVEVRAQVHGHCATHESSGETVLTLAPGETRRVELRFELDAREWRRQDIAFRLEEAGSITYEAHFAAGHTPRHGGACLVLKHGVRTFGGPPPENPEPGRADFAVAKRRYVLHRLPDFPEPGWWGGPQRDWILRDRRSALEVNLLADNAFERLGDVIAERFATDEDRVAAATMLVHRLMIYSPTGCRFAMYLDPLGSLRQGATICSGFTAVAHGLFAAIPRVDGGRGYSSLCASGHNHTIITVDLPGYSTTVDPTLGAFHYTRDPSRLATVEELAADPDLTEASLFGRREDYVLTAERSRALFPTLPYPPLTPAGEAEMRP